MPDTDVAPDVRTLAGLLARLSRSQLRSIDGRLLTEADRHGVLPLLADGLVAAGFLAELPPEIRDRLARSRREAVVLDAARREQDRLVLARLAHAGIDAIVFKGAALAATHYQASWLRPRGDLDLLVPVEQAAAAGALLEQMGYSRVPGPVGEHVTHQARYTRVSATVDVACDLHWQIADPAAFAGVLDHATLAAAAVPGPTAGARMANPVHALVIACVHRAAHHFDTDRLLLICDIDRLARRLTPGEWDAFVGLADRARVRAVCGRGLGLAASLLATPMPDGLRDRLSDGASSEPSARYVGGGLRRVDVLRSDLQQLPTWRARGALLREHLFPPRAYMASRYGATHPLLYPALYIDRILRGVSDWFRTAR